MRQPVLPAISRSSSIDLPNPGMLTISHLAIQSRPAVLFWWQVLPPLLSTGLRVELAPDGGKVVVRVAAKTSAGSGIQVGRFDHDQAHPMGRDALVTTSVI